MRTFNIVTRIKQGWHRDLASDPVTHGWGLNLYLNGERYPQTVCDYFQIEYAPTAELAEKLRCHERDEHKHEKLFERGLASIGQPVVILPPSDVFNEIVRSFTPGTFYIVSSDPPDIRREKLANFMAHAHFLEKRVASSLQLHADGCDMAGKPAIVKIAGAVVADEIRHVDYTRETVLDLLTRRRAADVFDAHRRAEARANLRFSSQQVAAFLNTFKEILPRRRRLLYRFCARILEGAECYA